MGGGGTSFSAVPGAAFSGGPSADALLAAPVGNTFGTMTPSGTFGQAPGILNQIGSISGQMQGGLNDLKQQFGGLNGGPGAGNNAAGRANVMNINQVQPNSMSPFMSGGVGPSQQDEFANLYSQAFGPSVPNPTGAAIGRFLGRGY